MSNRVFFPQASLDQWGIEGKIELTPTELVILSEGRRYAIAEVVHVVVEVTGAPDPHGLIGKVKSKSELEALNAEIMENSMIIGDNAYDVVPGWAGAPVVPLEEFLASVDHKFARKRSGNTGPEPKTDEQLIAAFARGAS